jgi:hypothetical protein
MIRGAFLLILLAASACASAPAVATNAAEVADPVSPVAGESARVLLLPVQGAAEGVDRERLGAELLHALRLTSPAVAWVGPEELRRALRRAPGLAADPDRLPHDPMIHQNERRVGDALASDLRRYGALLDARLVAVPRIQTPGRSDLPRLRVDVVDTRTMSVVRHAEISVEGDPADGARLAEVAERMARRFAPDGAS